jgi:hypothetical protein
MSRKNTTDVSGVCHAVPLANLAKDCHVAGTRTNRRLGRGCSSFWVRRYGSEEQSMTTVTARDRSWALIRFLVYRNRSTRHWSGLRAAMSLSFQCCISKVVESSSSTDLLLPVTENSPWYTPHMFFEK